jgi:hypothetical protein
MKSLARKLIRGNDTQFAAIFIHENIYICGTYVCAMLLKAVQNSHAAYPAFCSVFSLQILPDTWPSYYVDCSNQNRCLPVRLNRQRQAPWQLLFVEDNVHALAWPETSNLASKHSTLSLSTLLWRVDNGIMPSEVQQLFSTRSVSDVSWGKVRSLMEWCNTPGMPGWNFRKLRNNVYCSRYGANVNQLSVCFDVMDGSETPLIAAARKWFVLIHVYWKIQLTLSRVQVVQYLP